MCAAISERTLKDLGWPKLLGALAGRALTTLGAERARAWVLERHAVDRMMDDLEAVYEELL